MPDSGMIESIALNKDESFLVFGDRHSLVYLWDTKKRKLIKAFKKHTEWVKSVHFSPKNNNFLSCSVDCSIRVWNADEENSEFTLKGHTKSVRTATFTNDGNYIISAGDDLTIRI